MENVFVYCRLRFADWEFDRYREVLLCDHSQTANTLNSAAAAQLSSQCEETDLVVPKTMCMHAADSQAL